MKRKPEFITPLDVRKLGPQKWILLASLIFYSALLGKIIEVAKGRVTDFASVPRLPLVYLLTGNTFHRPAVIHDNLYDGIVSRKMADDIFLEGMLVVVDELALQYKKGGRIRTLWNKAKVNGLKSRAYSMWGAVRTAGGLAYRG